jgi:TonB-linked SusC/RagA family outer membrane protein
MKKTLLFLLISLWISFESVGQDRTISGKVTSAEDGSTLPGVNVVVKGTTNGTVTDANGAYSVSIPSSGTVLVFTFIGLISQEVDAGERAIIDIQMTQDAKQLTEVVVTAQGIERTKNELAYSAQKIDGNAVSQTRDNNFINGLSGKIAGVDIKRPNSMGGSTNVIIRGNKSLTGNNQALFIVDGVPIDNSNTNGSDQAQGRGGYDYGNAAADINPDDIESINVLKGAAATALYGSRAANGVILITTKKGKGAKGVGVTLNAGLNVGIVDKSTFAKYQNKYGEGYGAYYEDASGFFLERDVNGDGVLDLVTPTSEDASWGAPFDPNKQVYLWDAFDPTSPDYHKSKPFVAAQNDPSKFFKNSLQQSYSVMLDGASDKGYYKLGYSTNRETGILPNSSLNKDFVNFGASHKITNKLTAAASINVSRISGKGRYGSGYDDKNLMTNFRQWWAVTTDINDQKDAYFRNKKNITWNWADPDNLTPIYWDNPYFTRYENYENDNRLRYFGYTSLNYKIADWIDVLGRVSLDSYDEFQEERQAIGSVSTPYYSRYNRRFREYNYDLMVNINKKLTNSLNLKGVIGTNIRKTRVESIYATTNGGLVVDRYYALANSTNAINAPTETQSDLEVDGLYANASLGYKDLIFLDLAGRRDQSSSLPNGNNVYYYPSSSLSFVFSELIHDNAPWLNGGKFRVNYAEVGNTAPVQSITDVYDKPTAFGTVALFSVQSTKNNASLRPERTKSFEAGFELSFVEDRIGLDVTYYKQNTVDQIVPAPVSRTTGYDSKYINAGNVQNKGFEVSLYGYPLKSDNFSWKVSVNWTRNRSKVIELAKGIDNYQLGSFQGGVSINAAVGEPYGTIRGSNYVYNDKGQRLVDSDGFYQISATSNEVIGNINPDWIGGINNSFKYKNISLSFLIDMKKGGDIYNLDMSYGLSGGLYPETAGVNQLGNPIRNDLADGGGYLFQGVKEDGTPNDVMVDASTSNGYGVFGSERNPSKAFVYDASFVKLREVAITYSLPQSLVSKIAPFKGVDFSVIGRNLWIIHKNVPYADPEDGLGSGNLAAGYQVGTYPNVRNIGFNIKFKF